MNASYTALLLTSCISLPLCSMQEETLLSSTLSTNLTSMQIYDIKDLYNKTYERLETITPKNESAAFNLLEIIERTNHLKSQGITEHQIGDFAFNQKLSFKNQLLNHAHTPYNGPHYISVFFARLKEYNDILKKNDFSNPTIEDLASYKNNQNINVAILTASSFNLSIDIAPLKENNIFKEISDSVAIHKFHQLIADIYVMRCKNPTTIEAIATLLYDTTNAKK